MSKNFAGGERIAAEERERIADERRSAVADALRKARDSLDLIGDGDWTPQDLACARLCRVVEELLSAPVSPMNERNE